MKTTDYTPRHTWDKRLALPPGSVERIVHNDDSWIQAQTGAISVGEYWADVAAQLNLKPQETRRLAEDFYSGDKLDQDLVNYIRHLRSESFSVALLSNDSPELSTRLNHLGIADLFDPVVISAHIGVMKPASGAYQAVLDELNRPAEETVFVDDRQENVDGARALGIYAIHYTPDMNLPARLQPFLYAQTR